MQGQNMGIEYEVVLPIEAGVLDAKMKTGDVIRVCGGDKVVVDDEGFFVRMVKKKRRAR